MVRERRLAFTGGYARDLAEGVTIYANPESGACRLGRLDVVILRIVIER